MLDVHDLGFELNVQKMMILAIKTFGLIDGGVVAFGDGNDVVVLQSPVQVIQAEFAAQVQAVGCIERKRRDRISADELEAIVNATAGDDELYQVRMMRYLNMFWSIVAQEKKCVYRNGSQLLTKAAFQEFFQEIQVPVKRVPQGTSEAMESVAKFWCTYRWRQKYTDPGSRVSGPLW